MQIQGTSKEIADFVLALQNRQKSETVTLTPKIHLDWKPSDSADVEEIAEIIKSLINKELHLEANSLNEHEEAFILAANEVYADLHGKVAKIQQQEH